MTKNILARISHWFHEKSNSPQELSILYMRLRKCIGFIGVALPPVLIIGLILLEGNMKMLDSISVYYYSDNNTNYNLIGNVFVGCMFATGVFLICYQYRLLDDIISTLAGVCAIGVALFPTIPGCQNCATTHQMTTGDWHTRFAISFLSLLAVICLFLFPKSKHKDRKKRTPQKRMRNKVYYGCGIAMVIFLVLAALDMIVPYLSKAVWLQQYHPLTWLEILSVEAFGIAWFVKGETFGILKDKEAKSVYNGKTRMVASTLGVLAGALGIIHGLLEILQGNGVPGGIYTFAIGSPCQPNSTWYSCFPIITIVPHYYWISGILAIIIGTLIVIAAAAFVQMEYGGLALILLSILQLLFGGGYISPFLCLIAGLVATRTQDSFTWWTTNPTFRWQSYLAKLWPWSWIFPVIPVAIYIIPGFLVNEFIPIWFILTIVITLGLLLLTIFSAFAYDIQQRQDSTQQAPSVTVEFPPI